MGTTKIAIITARGGSKRIPHKNVKKFCGKPIIEYSIEAAIESGAFDSVMVSTDDRHIASVAEKAGAEVPFLRSKETSDDFATTGDVLNEVILEYRKKGKRFDIACCIYPTAPFVTAQKLKKSLELLMAKEAETVIPVVSYSFPPQRSMNIVKGKLKMLQPEYIDIRSQDLEPVYHDCGQFYTFWIDSFLKNGKLVGDKVVPLIMDEVEVQDIDNESDWQIAEIKYRMMLKRGKR